MQPFIFQREGRQSWYLVGIVDGRRKQISLKTDDKAEALRLLERWKVQPWGPRQKILWANADLSECGQGSALSKQQRALAIRTLQILQSQPNPEMFVALTAKPRVNLLAALGRCWHPEWIVETAKELIAQNLRGIKAIRFILDARNAHNRPPTFPAALDRAVRRLMLEFSIEPKLAADYLHAAAWGIESGPKI